MVVMATLDPSVKGLAPFIAGFSIAASAEPAPVKAIAVVNRSTGERLTVELEIGQSLWLLNDQGVIEKVDRAQLPAERWQIVEADPADCWDGGGQLGRPSGALE